MTRSAQFNPVLIAPYKFAWKPRTEPRHKKNVQRFIVVSGQSYRVYKRSGRIHAIMDGLLGWATIWAETYEDLVKRVKLAKRGGQ